MITLLTSWLLSRTILKGVPTTFTLELPPLRLPQVGRVLVRSVLDRTLFVLARAVTVAAPAGALIWVLANISFEGQSLLARGAGLLEPLGRALGLDGFILLAFILGLPANEIVLPILLMGYLSAGTMVEIDSLTVLQNILVHGHGWTWLTALCTMLFSLLHFPCGTTLFTIQRETKSLKWMFWAAAIPLAVACLVCFAVAQAVRALGLV
ncbi:nucleoside recognition domain-containing protein [Desulfofundulus kuznetsovii]|uniref:nucleoside recognition domain-containing protein n=1 Tax=Desulfofundulus kuznetsovii TaxID=58135 RepID=UPI0002FFBD1A